VLLEWWYCAGVSRVLSVRCWPRQWPWSWKRFLRSWVAPRADPVAPIDQLAAIDQQVAMHQAALTERAPHCHPNAIPMIRRRLPRQAPPNPIKLRPLPVLATRVLRRRMIEEFANGKILRLQQYWCRSQPCSSSSSRPESDPERRHQVHCASRSFATLRPVALGVLRPACWTPYTSSRCGIRPSRRRYRFRSREDRSLCASNEFGLRALSGRSTT